jgi:hypothetical protein
MQGRIQEAFDAAAPPRSTVDLTDRPMRIPPPVAGAARLVRDTATGDRRV